MRGGEYHGCRLAILLACAALAQPPSPAASEVGIEAPASPYLSTGETPANFGQGVSTLEDWSHGRTADTCLAKSLFAEDVADNGWRIVSRTGDVNPPRCAGPKRTVTSHLRLLPHLTVLRLSSRHACPFAALSDLLLRNLLPFSCQPFPTASLHRLQERAIDATDEEGAAEWYFDGGAAGFAGNLSAAYNGQLRFKFYTPGQTVPSHLNVKPRILGQDADIVLVSSCGYELWLDGVLAVSMTPRRYAVVLHEAAEEWIDSRTKHRATPVHHAPRTLPLDPKPRFMQILSLQPSQVAFLEALSNLAALRLRGGLLLGPETAHLAEVDPKP